MQGEFRVDVLDPVTGLRTGNGPLLSATRVSRQLALDRIGRFEFDVAADDSALDGVEGKDFEVLWSGEGRTHSLGRCGFLTLDMQAGGDAIATIAAASSLRDLQRQTVLQRSFDGASDDVNDVLREIVPLRSGWALGDVDTIANPCPLEFWYESIFESVALLAETFGYHFREGRNPRTLDFGAFGADSGVLAVGGTGAQMSEQLYANPSVAWITDLRVAYESDKVVNRLIPFGGAVGTCIIDLALCDSTQSGYPVNTGSLTGGGSYYYLEDTTSIAAYGLTERRFLRKDLRPITNSTVSRTYAANVLYEATLASLLNLKDRQTIYELGVVGLTPGQVRVGDKIRVLYRGWVGRRDGAQMWLEVDEDGRRGRGREFYVLEMEDMFGDGVTTRLKINENCVAERTVEDLLANTIRAFQQAQIHVQPTASRYTVGPYTKRVSTTVAANYSFNLGTETLDLWYVKVQLTGEPLKSSVASVAASGSMMGTSAAGGAASPTTSSGGASTPSSSSGGATSPTSSSTTHNHTFVVKSDSSPGTAGVYIKVGESASNRLRANIGGDTGVDTHTDGAHTHSVSIGNHTHDVTIGNHDHSVNINDHSHSITLPDHSHGMSYGIYSDTTYPTNLTLKVNGVTVASGIALNSGNNYTYELDITSYIKAAATLQQEHTIRVECGTGYGEIVFQAQVLAVIQPIEIN